MKNNPYENLKLSTLVSTLSVIAGGYLFYNAEVKPDTLNWSTGQSQKDQMTLEADIEAERMRLAQETAREAQRNRVSNNEQNTLIHNTQGIVTGCIKNGQYYTAEMCNPVVPPGRSPQETWDAANKADVDQIVPVYDGPGTTQIACIVNGVYWGLESGMCKI